MASDQIIIYCIIIVFLHFSISQLFNSLSYLTLLILNLVNNKNIAHGKRERERETFTNHDGNFVHYFSIILSCWEWFWEERIVTRGKILGTPNSLKKNGKDQKSYWIP